MKKTVKVDEELHRRIRARVVEQGGTIEHYVHCALLHSLGFRTLAPRKSKDARKRTKQEGPCKS